MTLDGRPERREHFLDGCRRRRLVASVDLCEQLTLLDGSGKALLRYTASNGAQAIKGSWEATMIYTGTALQSPVAGSKLTATFKQGVLELHAPKMEAAVPKKIPVTV